MKLIFQFCLTLLCLNSYSYAGTAFIGSGVTNSDLTFAEFASVNQVADSVQIYAEIKVDFENQTSIEYFLSLGLDLDHFHPQLGSNTVLLPREELEILENNNVSYKLLTNDVARSIELRNIEYLADNPISIEEKTTAGFELGSMGGFYTYAEVLAQLDEMKSLYPNLITDRFSIGTTAEGRTIWAVKISDNPDTNESIAEAPVYFDALHHAREPASMATVINFMFHLLENYAGNAQINYLVNNREIFFVPVVNPDGYEYNRQTNPNGGGLWRKNRRVNAGSSCRGVDLNRNYNSDFGGAGTSSNPCSNSYRGTSPFSEPESQAIRDFTTSIGSSIAYTTHTSGGYWLGPDFSNNQPEFAIHAELNSDCMDENEYIYGDANLILGYVAGTTQGWMYETLGTLSWTPEIGTTGFWPTVPEIIPLVNQQIKPYEYACWVAGAKADYQNRTITSSQGLSAGAPLELDIRVKNTGLSRAAENVSVSITTDNAGVTVVNGTRAYGNVGSRTFATNAAPFSFTLSPSVAVGTVVTFTVSVSQQGVESDTDSFQLTVGQPTILFSDDAENGSGAWSNGGSGTTWQTSDEDSYSGNSCFVDSRLGHTAVNNSRTFTNTNAVSLTGTNNPRLEFAAKWGLHTSTDYVRLQISANGGGWVNLSTASTETIGGAPAFKENEPWTFQSVNIGAYSGQSVRFRFVSFSNGSLPSDGFYFDDFKVIDYSASPTCSDGIQNGSETGVDCGGPDCSACITCNDGIQNGSETGVDCGGPDCTPCITCNDGIQNGSETGVDCGGPDCTPCFTCNDGVQNGSETGVDCGGPDCTPCFTCNDGVQNGSETGVDCGGPDCVACPTVGLAFDQGVVSGISDGWVSVPLTNNYSSMVVVATVVMPNSAAAPVATRIRNATGSSFDLRVQTTNGAAAGSYTVHYVVVEEGVYTLVQDGVKLEAVKVNSSVTAENNNWAIEARSYQQAYSNPVVVGQVMSFNDPDWSTFWASTATSRTNPPSASSFGAGKNVGEDPDNTRATELIGYLVIEAGSGTIGQTEYTAGLGADNVLGVGNTSTGYPYTINGLTAASSAVVSAAAMDGNNGGWPVLYGGAPFTPTQLRLAFDEDVANDTERAHTSEQIAYLAFGGNAGAGNCNDGIQNGSETGVDCGGPDCTACPTCSDGIQNGSETGVDCGGPDCAACETCTDGIQNGSETGVDCGGPDCAACETCTDGIQNGSETGIDCGGPDCLPCQVSYCSSSANSTQYEHIASITIAGVTNTSGDDNGYGDYTGTTAIPLSGTVALSLTPGFAGSAYNEGWVVWIDYNADGDFTDAGERALAVSGSSTVSGTITIPGGLTGTSRMRIQMRYNALNSSSCGTYAEGEVEDYTVAFGSGTKRIETPVRPAPTLTPVAALFPNPASTELTVRVNLQGAEEKTRWRIIDATGKVILNGTTKADSLKNGLRIDVRNVAAGIYYFSITNSEVKPERFVVQPR